MKKKITILFLMLLASIGSIWGWATDCGEVDCGLCARWSYSGTDEDTAKEILQKSGSITEFNIEPIINNEEYIHHREYKVTIKFNDWKSYAQTTWGIDGYVAEFGQYKITYEVYLNNDFIDSYTSTYDKKESEFESWSWGDAYIARNKTLQHTRNIYLDIPKTYTDNVNLTIKATVVPTTAKYYLNTWSLPGNCNILNAIKSHSVTSDIISLKILKHKIKTENTYKSLKEGNFYLVYGDDNAHIKISVPNIDNLNNKISSTLKPFSTIIGSVNQNITPDKINPCVGYSGDYDYDGSSCGELDYIEYRVNMPDILKNKIGDDPIQFRFKGVLYQTNNDGSIKTPTLVKLYEQEKQDKEIWYSKIFKLSDFKYTTKKSDYKNITKTGNKIKIAHVLYYATEGNISSSSNLLNYAVSTSATDSYLKGLTGISSYSTRSENVLNFYVTPKAILEKLSSTELTSKYVYVTGKIPKNENELIVLNEKSIKSIDGSLDKNIYNPKYVYEYSYDQKNWTKLLEADFIKPDFFIDKGDKYISTDILKNNSIVYIRQYAILQNFYSEIGNELYNEKIDDKYYIRINPNETDFYTIKKIPTITSDNIKLTGDITSNLNTKYDPESNHNGKTIKFGLIGLDADVIEAINKKATYSLSVKKNGISQNILNYNKDTGYYISDYKYGEWVFTCKLTLGNGEVITKDITLNSYPEAYFNQLTNEEKKAVYKCYTDGNNVTSKNEVISLKNKKVILNNQYLDLSLCLPEYYWEYSYDNTNWVKLDNTYKAEFSNLALSDGDFYISSAIFTENEKNVYFRQRAILKAFVSTDKKEQFTEYFESNGNKGYYIATTSGTYTFKKIPTPQDVNLSFVKDDNNISTDSKVCFLESADFYNGKKIELEFVKDANLSDDEFAALKNMALYKIYRKGKEEEGYKDTELNHPYTISGYENGQSTTYLCKIIFGETVSLEKEITISSYPEEKIDINKIETQTNGASIVSRDIAQMRIQAVCPKGEEFKIKYYLEDAIRPNIAAYESKIDYTCPDYSIINPFVPYEDVVPEVPYSDIEPEPVFVPTDFASLTIFDLYAILQKDADLVERIEAYYKVTIDRVAESQIEDFLISEEQAKFNAELAEYRLREQAHKDAYEADSLAYIDDYNAKKAEFEAECDKKITWQEFDDNLNYTTTLENITENKNNAVFYMRTKSTDENGGCYSGVVTINVTYIDGISNNLIEFVGDEYKGKDSIIVTAGEGNPAIKGELVEGGFGIPKDDADCIYSYSWKYYNEALSTWEKLVDDNGNELMFDEFNTNDGNRAEIRNVSLEADILKNAIASNPKGLKIARFVSSYKINEMSSKMEYMSNVLVIFSSKLIEDDKFTYEKSDKFCPGAGSVNILFTDVELEENEVLDVKVLEKDQEDLEKVFNYEKRYVSIVNPYKDFNVSICRRDTITNVKSNEVGLEIDIPEFKADFMVSVDYIDHELTEDRINVQSGSRVKLINTTVDEIGGTLYNWTLQVQKDGLLAQPSEKESPVCYLYNPGLNQIRLEVINANKCKSVVTADNIFVTGLPDNRSSSFFADDEANEQMLATESYIRVFPTILIDENIVNVQSNIERYDVVITDVAGKVMLVAENLTMSSTLDLAFLPNGIYILNASGNAFKLIKK